MATAKTPFKRASIRFSPERMDADLRDISQLLIMWNQNSEQPPYNPEGDVYTDKDFLEAIQLIILAE